MKIKNTCLNPRHPNTSGILLGVLSEPENVEVALDVDRGIVRPVYFPGSSESLRRFIPSKERLSSATKLNGDDLSIINNL